MLKVSWIVHDYTNSCLPHSLHHDTHRHLLFPAVCCTHIIWRGKQLLIYILSSSSPLEPESILKCVLGQLTSVYPTIYCNFAIVPQWIFHTYILLFLGVLEANHRAHMHMWIKTHRLQSFFTVTGPPKLFPDTSTHILQVNCNILQSISCWTDGFIIKLPLILLERSEALTIIFLAPKSLFWPPLILLQRSEALKIFF